MAASLLHKSKLEQFKLWLSNQSINHRPGKGTFQVLQVNIKNQWLCIYERLDSKEHFTNDRRLNNLVAKFCKESKTVNEKLTDQLMEVMFG